MFVDIGDSLDAPLERALRRHLRVQRTVALEVVPFPHRASPLSPMARLVELERLGGRLGVTPRAAERLTHGLQALGALPDLTPEMMLRLLRLRIRLRRHHEAAEADLLSRLVVGNQAADLAGEDDSSPEAAGARDAAANSLDLLTGELAAIYRISRRGSARRVAVAQSAARLPRLRSLHRAGEIDHSHLRVAAEATSPLRSEEQVAAVDAALARRAPRLSVGETRLLAQRAVLEADPELAANASAAAARSADVQLLLHDGGAGADLVATGTVTDVAELMAAVETRAGLCEHVRETGAAGRARFDALLALVRGGLDATLACTSCGQVIVDRERGSRRRRARTRVLVTVPYETLTSESDRPAQLDRYGPISAREARRVVCRDGAVLQRLRYDPATGIATDLDPRRYRLTALEADLLASRDGVCTASGCSQPATTCEVDHRFEVAGGGVTAWCNLQSLCGPDHDGKTEHGWAAERSPAGGTRWISPYGLVHETDPTDHRPLLPPKPSEPAADDPDPPF